jgi:hypothetical protein
VNDVRYELVVQGELSERFAHVFDGMRMEHVGGTTRLVGTVVDQAHLHGLLERVASLGLELVSVAPCGDEE